MRSLIRAGALALAISALVPAAASAATVTVESGVLVLRAAPGEDSLRVEGGDDDASRVALSGPSISSYPGICKPSMWSTGVECVPQPGGVRVEAGAGDDNVNVYAGVPGGQNVFVQGGDGNDELSAGSHGGTTRLEGGPGNDELLGSAQADALFGGPGDDTLGGRGGNDEVRGEDGADNLAGDFQTTSADVLDGGAGPDVIESDWSVPYGAQQPYVTVSLDGQANDGRPGEGDNVTSIEKMHLKIPASLSAAGDPVDFEVFNNSSAGARLVGSPGADRLRTYDAADEISAGAGDDWIEAGFANDVIDPGPGRDTVNAEAGTGACNFLVCRQGSGNDTVNARDGEADSIDCGVGTDTANVDPADTVSGCETVNVGTGGPGPGPGGARACKVPRVKRGAKPRTVQRSLKKAGCRAKLVRTRSRNVKAGRVVKLSHKAGKRLKRGATVKVYVAKAGGRAAASAAGTWYDPREFKVTYAGVGVLTILERPDDGDGRSFKGVGTITLRPGNGIKGSFKLPGPNRRGMPSVSMLTAKPVIWTMKSEGGWTTKEGFFDCGMKTGPDTGGLAGVVSAMPKRKGFRIQWSYHPAGFACGPDAPHPPSIGELPSKVQTVDYPASLFKAGRKRVELAINLNWDSPPASDGTTLKISVSGRIVLGRIQRKLG